MAEILLSESSHHSIPFFNEKKMTLVWKWVSILNIYLLQWAEFRKKTITPIPLALDFINLFLSNSKMFFIDLLSSGVMELALSG